MIGAPDLGAFYAERAAARACHPSAQPRTRFLDGTDDPYRIAEYVGATVTVRGADDLGREILQTGELYAFILDAGPSHLDVRAHLDAGGHTVRVYGSAAAPIRVYPFY
jgi:hypothetical protein